MKRAAALAALAVLLGGSGAHGGMYSPPPGDGRPVWSPDGSAIVFTSARDVVGLRVVARDGSGERRLPLPSGGSQHVFSPDWSWVAYYVLTPGRTWLTVSRPEGSEVRTLAEANAAGPPSWSPDGSRIAFSNGAVYTVRVDGGELERVADNGIRPAWSRDGSRIAFVPFDGALLGGVRIVDHAGVRTIAPELSITSELAWSPDGARIAAISHDTAARSTMLDVLGVDGSRLRVKLPTQLARAAWRGNDSVVVSGRGIYELALATGELRRLSSFGYEASASPDLRELVFAGDGECGDRTGIYRFRVVDGTPVRLTHDCRIRGTEGPDRLVGTALFDILQGLGGDDELAAWDPGYVGERVEGGAGDDTIVGGYRPDSLDGGPGADRIEGGPGGDTVVGGAGRDVLLGEGGVDTIRAIDGMRDRISCGTHASRGTNAGLEEDVAHADARDVVARDCEFVRDRTGAIVRATATANLTIRVWPRGYPGTSRHTTLRCEPAGGTLPRAAKACARLARMLNPFAPVPRDRGCAEIYGGPQVAFVSGRLRGGHVGAKFNRRNGCEIERWERLAFLFARPG